MQPIAIETVAHIIGATVTRRASRGGNGTLSGDITGISTDSRTIHPGDGFFAIPGDHFDGHDYVAEVFEKGAVCAVVSRTIDVDAMPGPILRVHDTVEVLGDLAREYRLTNSLKVVAITGSVGKTTTRQIAHHVLSRHFRTHQAQKSFNNHIGLPLTLLGAGPEDELVIAELGANHPGEIGYLTGIARPDIAVVTNASPAHLQGFGDISTIIREKLSIADGLPANGTLIINGDIEPLVAACREMGRPFRTFGKMTGVDYRAEHVVCKALHSTFEVNGKQIRLPLPGPGNVENALAAWAVCERLGLTIDGFADAVASLSSVSMRAETLQIGTLTVLNDCYNANPASMKNALTMLRNLRGDSDTHRNRRLVFICGEMAELGAQTQALHEELGAAVAEAGVDLLVAVGAAPRVTARIAREKTRHDLQTRCFDDTAAVCDHMPEFLRNDDIILVKGSRTARLERVVEELIKDDR